MGKLTDKQKKKIIADYLENQNYSETARINGVSNNTVKSIFNENKDNSKKLIQKKEENTQSTLDYMENQHQTKKRILEKILRSIEIKADDIDKLDSIKDLATAYGIIIDKELKKREMDMKNSASNEEIEKGKELLIAIKEVAGVYENRD